MRTVVSAAASMAAPGDVVLLAPAAASLDMYCLVRGPRERLRRGRRGAARRRRRRSRTATTGGGRADERRPTTAVARPATRADRSTDGPAGRVTARPGAPVAQADSATGSTGR